MWRSKNLASIEERINKMTADSKVFTKMVETLQKKEQILLHDYNFITKVMASSPDTIYVYDLLNHKNIWVNNQVELLLGYTQEEIASLSGTLLKNLMHPDDFEAYLKNTYPKYVLLKPGETVEHEYRMLKKDGSVRWFHAKELIFSFDEEGFPTQILGHLRDITEKKEQELALRLQSEALNKAANSIVITNVDGNIIFVNETFLRTMGYTLDEVINQNPRILKSGEHTEEFYKDLWDTLLAGKTWSKDIINKTKTGLLVEEHTTITPIYNGKINYFIAIKERI